MNADSINNPPQCGETLPSGALILALLVELAPNVDIAHGCRRVVLTRVDRIFIKSRIIEVAKNKTINP